MLSFRSLGRIASWVGDCVVWGVAGGGCSWGVNPAVSDVWDWFNDIKFGKLQRERGRVSRSS